LPVTFFFWSKRNKVTKKEKHPIFVSCFLGEPEIIATVSRTPNSGQAPQTGAIRL